jgi:TolA-binding protein
MSDERPPDENGRLLRFIASTVEVTRDRVDTLSGRIDTLDGRVDSLQNELRVQTTAIRGDIEQVQLRLDSIERALAAPWDRSRPT